MKRLLTLRLCCALLALGFTGCAKEEEPTLPTDENGLVTSFDNRGLKISVDDVKYFVPDDLEMAEGMKLMEVTVTVENTSDGDMEYSTMNFAVCNEDGNYAYTVIGYSYNADTMLKAGTLKPGESASGTIIYEKSGDGQLWLTYFMDGFDKESTHNLNIPNE